MGELIDLAAYRTARDTAEVEQLREEVRDLLDRVFPLQAELFYDHPFMNIRESCKVDIPVV